MNYRRLCDELSEAVETMGADEACSKLAAKTGYKIFPKPNYYDTQDIHIMITCSEKEYDVPIGYGGYPIGRSKTITFIQPEPLNDMDVTDAAKSILLNYLQGQLESATESMLAALKNYESKRDASYQLASEIVNISGYAIN